MLRSTHNGDQTRCTSMPRCGPLCIWKDMGALMRFVTTLILMATGSAAAAHPGHPELLGLHEPWMIGAGIGAIILAGLLGKKKGEKADPEDAPEGESA